MQLFYQAHHAEAVIKLTEDTARHIAQVLRMQVGEHIMLTNGLGKQSTAQITEVGKKNVIVAILNSQQHVLPTKQISLGIAFTKNNNRMEWLLEKITEIGVTNIYPIITQRSEHNKINADRFNKILVTAMCQSKQFFIPQLHEPVALEKLVLKNEFDITLMAHCIENDIKKELKTLAPFGNKTLLLIGPEGDFSAIEIEKCVAHNCIPISLGNTRLRTETAGLVGVTLLNNL
jgi:16S rRNA (uracil1498-N3)-methyltransferase